MREILHGMVVDLLLPPFGLVLAILALAALVARRRRAVGFAIAACAAGILLLGTPAVGGMLAAWLDRATPIPPPGTPEPAAIVVLGGEIARGAEGPEVGPLTLERLRAGAALHRRLHLPLLVTGGEQRPDEPTLAELMRRSLDADFGIAARWVEPAARDTAENAARSAALLRAEGIHSAWLVTHAWHMARAAEAFERNGITPFPAPVRASRDPAFGAGEWVPRPDRLAGSWYMLRECAGRLVYALRDGR